MKQNIIQTKKGIALSQAFGAVLTLVLVGVLVIIAIFMFVTLGATFNTTSATTTNESGAYLNQTGYTLVNSTDCNFNNPSINTVWNNTGTNNSIITASNYEISSDGLLRNATTQIWLDVNLTYSYLNGGAACEATDELITQFGTYPVLVGLVGTIIFLGLVIGVLVASFVFGGRRNRGV